MSTPETSDRWPGPPDHLRRPRPLVVDLDQGVLAGSGAALPSPDPAGLRIHRPALDLIRLQRRFRGPVLLLSALPRDWALWLGDRLGAGDRVLATGRRAEDKAVAALKRFEVRGFDFLGDVATVTAVGPYAHRLWLMGGAETLKARFRTSGVPLVRLDAEDTLALRDLAPPGVSGWDSPAGDTRLSPLSVEATRRRAP